MTRVLKTKIKCGKCAQEFEVNVYDSINVTINPELKEKVLRGEINFGICPNCGAPHKITKPFLYHDIHKQCMIWVRLEEERVQKERFMKELEELKKRFPFLSATDYTFDVVFSIRELKNRLNNLQK